MHGIITLTGVVGAALAAATVQNSITKNKNFIAEKIGMGASPTPTNVINLGDIVGAYKSLTANGCLEIFKQKHPGEMMGKLWQRSYYEHIIRDEQSYQRIYDYIVNNPKNWNNDTFR